MPRRLSKSDRERIIEEVAELAKEPRERMPAVSPIGFRKTEPEAPRNVGSPDDASDSDRSA